MATAWGDLVNYTTGNQKFEQSLELTMMVQVAFLNLPTTDLFSAPSQQRLEEGVAWMVDEASSGKCSLLISRMLSPGRFMGPALARAACVFAFY